MRLLLALLLPWFAAGCGADSTAFAPLADAANADARAPAVLDAELVEAGEGFLCADGSSALTQELDDPARGLCGNIEPASAASHALASGVAYEGDALGAPRELGGECHTRIRTLQALPSLPGALGLEANRARVLSYAKAEPVWFVRTPEFDVKASSAARTYRSILERSTSPWGVLQKLVLVFAANPSLGRNVLLREGYLYAEKPELAFALVDLVKAHHLFDAPRIWIHRGEELLTAERTSYGQYVYADGAQVGQRVRLLLFDRVGEGQPPDPLHRDFRSLRQRLGFDRAQIRHIGEHELLAELRYGSVTIPTVLTSVAARLELGCELLPPDLVPTLAAIRSRHERQTKVLSTLRRVILAGVEEGLPFDEPLTEYGQQDGQLRRFWLKAYLDGKSTYEINGDRYNTFDPRGRPLVPQVCVDFVLDTFERASGTWWRNKGELPGRVSGNLDFGTLADETLRRASSLIDMAVTRSEWFDMWELPPAERIPLKHTMSFVDYLVEHADEFVPGDVVLIRGYAPWDKPWKPRVMHYHTFFVYETDPLTGFPAMLVGNPGRPLLQTWQFEAFRTPDRSIWYRMRPRLEWLEQVVVANEQDENLLSAPLSAGPS